MGCDIHIITEIKKDVTLYAVWTANQYKVIYNPLN